MNAMRVVLLMLVAVPVIHAQGIRGVTRRTPTVVYGQQPAQFFAAGGLPLNAPTNIAAIPGSPNQRLAGQPAAIPANTLAARPLQQPKNNQPAGVRPVAQPAASRPVQPR